MNKMRSAYDAQKNEWIKFDENEAREYIGKNGADATSGTDLYKTKFGTWILYKWSRWQGAKCTYKVITVSEANQWLAENGYTDESDVREV